MRNTFVTVSAILFALCTISAPQVYAQDTLKNVKKAAVRPIAVKPLPIDPVTGKPRVPINPKPANLTAIIMAMLRQTKTLLKPPILPIV